MDVEPTHDSYEAVIKDARKSKDPIGEVILRAGTELEIYQVWSDFRLATSDGLFDIWAGSPPRFVPSPLARRPFSSISTVLSETPQELVNAYQTQAGCPLELIPEHRANAFDFGENGPEYSDLLLFGPNGQKETIGEWVRGLVSDRVNKHLETENLTAAHNLLAAFHNGTSTST